MFETLTNYLDLYATPEQKVDMIRACQILVDAGYIDHASEIELRIAAVENDDQDIYLSLYDEYLKPLYIQQLQEFGIVAKSEASLKDLATLFMTVNRIDNWGDPWTINDACATDEGPSAMLADILAIVGDESSEFYLNLLDDVSQDLIDKTQALTQDLIDNGVNLLPELVIEGKRTCAERIDRLWGQIPPEHGSMLRDYLDTYGKLFIAPKYIANRYFADLLDLKDKVRASRELMMLLAASTLTTSVLAEATMSLVEQLGFEAADLTQVSSEIHSYIQKVS